MRLPLHIKSCVCVVLSLIRRVLFTANCLNTILNMDANSDIKRITDALDNLKQKNIGHYQEKIMEFRQKERD